MRNISLLLEQLFLANYGFAFPEHTQAYRGRLVQTLTRKQAKPGGVHDEVAPVGNSQVED